MSVERLKTIVLVFLIALSIVLSGKLWYGVRPLPAVVPIQPEERVFRGEQKETIDLLAPVRATLSLGEGRFAVFGPDEPLFREGWQIVSTALKQAETWEKSLPGKPSAPPDLDAPGTWQWDFPLTLSFGQWRELFRQQGREAAGPRLARLVVTPTGESFLYDPEAGYFPWLTDIDLPDQKGEDLLLWHRPRVAGYSFAPGIYLPPEGTKLPVLRAKVERLPAESVASTFFVDMSLVRKIRERDGAVIYTDGQRALRVYPSGALEYSFPGRQAGSTALTLGAAWERGRLFVEQHGGWPDNVRIADIEKGFQDGEEYFCFRYRQYYQGIPLVLPNPAITLRLNSSGVVVYERLAAVTPYPGEEPQPLVAPLPLLDKVRELPGRPPATKGEDLVTGLSLAYYGQLQGKRDILLKPVWVVEVAGERQFYFDAHTGKLQVLPEAGPGKEEVAWTGAGPRAS